jgi:hypothetical protein
MSRKHKKGQVCELSQKQSELLALLTRPTKEQKQIAARLFDYLTDEEVEVLVEVLQARETGKIEPYVATATLHEAMWRLVNASTKDERQDLGWESLTPSTIPAPDWSVHDLVLGRTPPKTLLDRIMVFLASRLTERRFARLVEAFLGRRRDPHLVELRRSRTKLGRKR